MSVKKSARDLEMRTLDGQGFRDYLKVNKVEVSDGWPIRRWDLDLLTWAAFYFHPSLEVARAQWDGASAGVRTAAARPNPTVNLTPGYNFNAASVVSPWFPGASFDVPIETAGKRGKREEAARFLADASRFDLAVAAWKVRTGLHANLIECVAGVEREKVLEALLKLQREAVGLLEQRLAAGTISVVEVSGARLALLKIEGETADARRLRAEQLAHLSETIGVPLSAMKSLRLVYSLGDGLVEKTGDLAAMRGVLREVALTQRADVLSGLAAYQASDARLRLELAKQYPDLHLGSGYQWDQGENKWNLSLSLEVPLLDRNQGPIAEADLKRKEVGLRLIELQSRIVAELDLAFVGLDSGLEQVAETGRIASLVRERVHMAEARLKVGLGDVMEKLAGGIELGQAERAVFESKVRLDQAQARLEGVVQVPFRQLEGLLRASSISSTTAVH